VNNPRELDDEDWRLERDAAALEAVGVDAAGFIDRFTAGDYNDDPDRIEGLLMMFPELG